MIRLWQSTSNKPVKLATILISAFFLCAVVILPGVAVADSYKTPENSSPQEVADAMSTKFARGIANVATGWVEFPKQIYITAEEDGWGRALAVGPLKGIVMMLVRTVSGAAEIVTFPIPFPGFYEPYFDPAYVWQKE